MNLFNNHLFLESICVIVNSNVGAAGVWSALKKRKGIPNQSSLNSDYNKKLIRVAWVTGLGSFLLSILVIYLSTIVPSNQVLLFGLLPGIVLGILYFPINHRRVPSQPSLKRDYNQKWTRIAWITASGCLLLPIPVMTYLITIKVPLYQTPLSGLVPIAMVGGFYYSIIYVSISYEREAKKKLLEPQ